MKAETIAENAIGLFSEYRDKHGYSEGDAMVAAIREVVEGIAAEDEGVWIMKKDQDTSCACKVIVKPAAAPETPWGQIEYCPLHQAAGQMLEALKKVRRPGLSMVEVDAICHLAIAAAETKGVTMNTNHLKTMSNVYHDLSVLDLQVHEMMKILEDEIRRERERNGEVER